MATTVIRFVVLLPSVSDPNQYQAEQNFINTIVGLDADCQQYETSKIVDGTPFLAVDGYITSTQSATALSALNTLNTALGVNVRCFSQNVQLQP